MWVTLVIEDYLLPSQVRAAWFGKRLIKEPPRLYKYENENDYYRIRSNKRTVRL
jgi:hypothetical protein